MRAARFYGITDLRIEEIPKPIPKENEVLVDVEWCGICGSDLHEYEHGCLSWSFSRDRELTKRAGPSSIPKEGKPHVLTKEAIPITMGHEFCGRISQVSPKSKLKVGQPVMVDPRLYCESCNRCEVKGTNVCYSWGFKGLSGGGGGLSETVAVEEKMCYALPETADLSVAALIEPLAVAMHVVKNTGIADFAKMSILILGGGPIGLAMIMILRTKGAKTIYVSEPTLKRQEQNREFADLVFDPTKERVGDRCKELSGGEGVDIVFDCAGNEFAMKDGMEALRWRGKYANVAGWVKPVSPLPHHYPLLRPRSS